MSLEAIEKVTQIETENRERKAAAEAEAQKIVADAERDGLALLQQARSSAAESGKELLRQEILQMGGFALSGEIVERQFYIAIWEKQEEGTERELLRRASLLCEKFAAGGVACGILAEKEIVRLLNLVNNPSYTHLEDAETAASMPMLKGVI